MKPKRASKATARTTESKTRGTIWAEENRARCNKLTDEEREPLMNRALELIYGRKTAARRR